MMPILSMTLRIDNVVGPPRTSRYRDDMSTQTTGRGFFSAFERPERGAVHATMGEGGAAMKPVYLVPAALEKADARFVAGGDSAPPA
jgi:hypothetical protein